MIASELLETIRRAGSARRYVEDALLSRLPWIFDSYAEGYQDWRMRGAAGAGVGPASLVLVGSAAVGYSLSPRKPGRPFRRVGSHDRPSDIDIAIVDEALFDELWDDLVRHDRDRRLRTILPPSPPGGSGSLDRVRTNVYWGTISDSSAPPGTKPARRIRLLFAATTRSKPFVGYLAKARVYRRQEDLVAYHEQSVRQLLRALEETAEDDR